MVTSPPARNTPLTTDSECDTAVCPSKKFAVVPTTEPTWNNDVSTGASGWPGTVTPPGSGNPVLLAPTGAMRKLPMAASVDDDPSSPMWECAPPPSPLIGPFGSPKVTAPAVLGSVLNESASVMNGHFVCVQAAKIGATSGNAAANGGPACPQARAGPLAAPAPGSASAACALGPLLELIV